MKRLFCIVGITALSIIGSATIATATEKLNKADKAFISSYRQAVGRVQSANLRKPLLQTAEKPYVVIKSAKSVCSRLQSGMTLQEVIAQQSEIVLEKQRNDYESAVLIQTFGIIDRLAVPHYCPKITNL